MIKKGGGHGGMSIATIDGEPITGAANEFIAERIVSGYGQQAWSDDGTRVTMRCPFSKMFTTYLVRR